MAEGGIDSTELNKIDENNEALDDIDEEKELLPKKEDKNIQLREYPSLRTGDYPSLRNYTSTSHKTYKIGRAHV